MGCCVLFFFISTPLSGSNSLAGLFSLLLSGEYSSRRGHSAYGQGAVELASASPVFCSRLFVVWEASVLRRHVISLSHLTEFFLQSHLSIVQSAVLCSIQMADLDSRQTCSSCSSRMSNLLHDRHSGCVMCRGVDCTFDVRCEECSSWKDKFMLKYVKHMKSLANKSRPRKAKKPSEVKFSDARLRSSPGDSGATPSGSADASSVACVTEARVEELISCQISKLSSSFAPSMDASFVNIKHMIDSRLSSSVSQDV